MSRGNKSWKKGYTPGKKGNRNNLETKFSWGKTSGSASFHPLPTVNLHFKTRLLHPNTAPFCFTHFPQPPIYLFLLYLFLFVKNHAGGWFIFGFSHRFFHPHLLGGRRTVRLMHKHSSPKIQKRKKNNPRFCLFCLIYSFNINTLTLFILFFKISSHLRTNSASLNTFVFKIMSYSYFLNPPPNIAP